MQYTLQDILNFVKSPEYKQSHIASQDTEDLWDFVKYLYKSEGDIIFAKYDCINLNIFDMTKLQEELQTEKQRLFILSLVFDCKNKNKKLTSELNELLDNPNRTGTQASDIIDSLKALLKST